jgi:hypothetical protein
LDGILSEEAAGIAIQVADTNAQPVRNAHFALDVIALDPIRALSDIPDLRL